jgi:thiol-disulfide isomerase/thioredoxin
LRAGAAVVLLASAAALADEESIRSWGDKPTPLLATKSLDGRSVDLKDFRGRVVLVNFWATWCGPCKEELPSFVKLKEKLAGKPFDWIAVNDGESVDTITRYVKRAKLDLPVWIGPEDSASSGWNIRGLPMTFLVDARGHIRYWAYGDRNWSEGESLKLIESLIAEAGHA